MAGKPEIFTDGIRLPDMMSVMVLTNVFPLEKVNEVLAQTGKTSARERNLPATLMVYYVIALALYRTASYQQVLRTIFDAFNCLWDFSKNGGEEVTISCKAAVSQARSRLGSEPMKLLYRSLVRPIAQPETPGAFFHGLRCVSLDGATMDLGDTVANEAAFSRPASHLGPGSAFPQIRFVSLVESGTHVLFGAEAGPYSTSEVALAKQVITRLEKGMLCLADRGFYSYELWTEAASVGSDLLWRMKKDLVLPSVEILPDGSYLSIIYPNNTRKRQNRGGKVVRVIDYHLVEPETKPVSKKQKTAVQSEVPEEEDTNYRLLTTLLDPAQGSALELAALYASRWEIEITLDEFKTHLRGRDTTLRSKTPDGVLQEFWGLLLAHHAVRHLMHQAAQSRGVSALRLSYTHALQEIQRKLPLFLVISPSEPNN